MQTKIVDLLSNHLLPKTLNKINLIFLSLKISSSSSNSQLISSKINKISKIRIHNNRTPDNSSRTQALRINSTNSNSQLSNRITQQDSISISLKLMLKILSLKSKIHLLLNNIIPKPNNRHNPSSRQIPSSSLPLNNSSHLLSMHHKEELHLLRILMLSHLILLVTHQVSSSSLLAKLLQHQLVELNNNLPPILCSNLPLLVLLPLFRSTLFHLLNPTRLMPIQLLAILIPHRSIIQHQLEFNNSNHQLNNNHQPQLSTSQVNNNNNNNLNSK